MGLYDTCYEIQKIQKFRRLISYAGFYCFATVVTFAYTNNTTRVGFSRGDQLYASYPAGTEMLTDTAKLYKAALGNCFEVEDWGPIEFCVMAKHFERQGKSPYAYHANRSFLAYCSVNVMLAIYRLSMEILTFEGTQKAILEKTGVVRQELTKLKKQAA